VAKLVQLFRDVSGATAIEYGLIAAFIAVAISAIVLSVGDALVSAFTTVEAIL